MKDPGFTDASRTGTGPISISARWIPRRFASRGRAAHGPHKSPARTCTSPRRSRRSMRRSSRRRWRGRSRGRLASLAWLAAFGQKREIHGNLEAFLSRRRSAPPGPTRLHACGIGGEGHPRCRLPSGAFHRHRQSQVGALTAGYMHDWWRGRGGSIGTGADVTGHVTPANLEQSVRIAGFVSRLRPIPLAAERRPGTYALNRSPGCGACALSPSPGPGAASRRRCCRRSSRTRRASPPGGRRTCGPP